MDEIDKKLPSANTQNATDDTLSTKVQVNAAKIKQVSMQQDICKSDHDRLQIMADVIIRQDEHIHELKNQMLQMQARSMRNNLIINGILETKDEDCDQLAKDFISQKLTGGGGILHWSKLKSHKMPRNV